MCAKLHKILVTGGAGFIGSAFVRLIAKRGYKVVVLDKLTYAADLKRLKELNRRFKFYKADICDKKSIEAILRNEEPDAIVNFAAETHVDRSIRDATKFMDTNIRGTQILLDAAKKCGLDRFIHISSDEVYGDTKTGRFCEESPLRPSNPYSASKAAADLVVKSYIRTYDFPATIVRPSNNYGPWQYPEKLIPLTILKILRDEKIPLYGDGKNVREWLYVEDSAQGILAIVKKGRRGEIYNLGGNQEFRNIDTVRIILNILGKKKDLISFVQDRPGHDLRYNLDSRKVLREIGWEPSVKFKDGLRLMVQWCLRHKMWLFSKWKDIVKLYE